VLNQAGAQRQVIELMVEEVQGGVVSTLPFLLYRSGEQRKTGRCRNSSTSTTTPRRRFEFARLASPYILPPDEPQSSPFGQPVDRESSAAVQPRPGLGE
jgi:hypothetical protein